MVIKVKIIIYLKGNLSYLAMLGVMRLQSSARPDIGLVNKRSEFMKFLGAKIFFKANP